LIFLKILEVQPRNIAAREWLGNIAFQQRRLTDAIVHYRQALKLCPGWPQAEIMLSAILSLHRDPLLRNPDEAVRMAEHACAETNHQRIEFLDILVLAYGEAGRYDLAITTAVEAIGRANTQGKTQLAKQLAKKLETYRAKQQAATTRENP